MADDWISEVNAHSDVNCWCRGTHAEGLHSIWERRRDADQLRAENADLRARLAEVEAERDAAEMALDNKRNAVEGQRRRAEAAEARLARVEALCDLVETYDHPVAWHTEIRAAIEGDTAVSDKDVVCDAEDDWCFTHDRKHFRCYVSPDAVESPSDALRGPQDEEAAEDWIEQTNLSSLAHLRAKKAEAKLAAVRVLCDEARDGWSEGRALLAEQVLALIETETDR